MKLLNLLCFTFVASVFSDEFTTAQNVRSDEGIQKIDQGFSTIILEEEVVEGPSARKLRKLTADKTAMNKTFLHPEVANRKIIAVSVSGFEQQDSNILLEAFLRLFYANVS